MIKECSVQELKQKLDAKENIIFIDCREQPEWDEARIPGAKLLPLSKFEAIYENFLTDKNACVVVHCRSGARSMNACMFLLSKGFTNVTNVRGGIMSWAQEGHPIITK